MRSATLHFLDYALPWFLRCDAFTVVCGGILLHGEEAVESKCATEDNSVHFEEVLGRAPAMRHVDEGCCYRLQC